jgi:hypothetical protein
MIANNKHLSKQKLLHFMRLWSMTGELAKYCNGWENKTGKI